MKNQSTARAGRVLIIGALTLAATLTGCATATPGSASAVHIAAVLPLTGALARQGNLELAGAKFAVEEINEAGGITSLDGAQIVLDVQDAGATVESAVTATNRALGGELPAAAVGAYASSLTLGATEVSERKHVPWVTVSFADSITDRGFQYVFQTSPVASALGSEGLSDFVTLVEEGGTRIESIALIGDNTAASAAFLDTVENSLAPKLGLSVSTRQDWTPPLTDASGIAAAVAENEPDAVVYTSVSQSDTALVVNALRQFGVDAPMVALGSGILLPEYLKSVGAEAMEGITAIVGASPGPESARLVEAFAGTTGEPWMTQDAISGYSELWLIKEALEGARSSAPEDVAAALREIDLDSGPAAENVSGGRIRFDEAGHRLDAVPMLAQWQAGKPVTVWPAGQALAAFDAGE